MSPKTAGRGLSAHSTNHQQQFLRWQWEAPRVEHDAGVGTAAERHMAQNGSMSASLKEIALTREGRTLFVNIILVVERKHALEAS
jgi:hypothetical protein